MEFRCPPDKSGMLRREWWRAASRDHPMIYFGGKVCRRDRYIITLGLTSPCAHIVNTLASENVVKASHRAYRHRHAQGGHRVQRSVGKPPRYVRRIGVVGTQGMGARIRSRASAERPVPGSPVRPICGRLESSAAAPSIELSGRFGWDAVPVLHTGPGQKLLAA